MDSHNRKYHMFSLVARTGSLIALDLGHNVSYHTGLVCLCVCVCHGWPSVCTVVFIKPQDA